MTTTQQEETVRLAKEAARHLQFAMDLKGDEARQLAMQRSLGKLADIIVLNQEQA